jgi:hypothetical protein
VITTHTWSGARLKNPMVVEPPDFVEAGEEEHLLEGTGLCFAALTVQVSMLNWGTKRRGGM